jgi:hypothetical protein
VTSWRAVAIAVATALLAIGQQPPAISADAPAPRPLPRAMFGMHDGDPTSWPEAPVGSVRLWDTGVTWRDVEVQPGVFDFTRLDAQVAAALRHRAKVTLVLGQTPSFHVARTAQPAGPMELLGPGASRMPEPSAWRRYVRRVASRYGHEIEALQVWNEANILGFWSGTPRQMAVLTAESREVLDRVNDRAGTSVKLVAPSFVARTNTLPMDRYWRVVVRGHRVADLVDVVALSTYPPADGGPEESVRRLRQLWSTILDRRHVALPVWNTEINYGLASGGSDDPVQVLPDETQAAYVIRTFLLNAAAGVRRVFWYGWEQRGNVAVVLSEEGRSTLAGRAVTRIRRWTRGADSVACRRVGDGATRGLRICRLADDRGARLVYWHPQRPVTVRLPRDAVWVRDLHGARRPLTSRALAIDDRPILVRVLRR